MIQGQVMQGDYQVRDADKADIPLLHALVQSAYRGDSARAGWTHEADMLDDERITVEGLAALIDGPGQHLLTAWVEDGLAGCAHVRLLSPDTAYFGLFAVDPYRQNGGLGKYMLAVAEETARQRLGAARMEMTVITRRSELIAYYERRGYRQTGETRPFPAVTEPPLFFVVLEKMLAPVAG